MARIAGIMAAKRTQELIPLCHPIPITHVSLELETVAAEGEAVPDIRTQTTGEDSSPSPGVAPSVSPNDPGHGSIVITATVSCDGKTGVEMEALTAASVAALTVYDMCKAVDKGMRIDGLRVVRKDGGKSGVWVNGVNIEE